jgi:hypothetical protein
MFINDYAQLKENILSSNFLWHGHIEIFFEVVKATGYPFFSWNGRVYKVEDGRLSFSDTGLLIKDFK